MLKKVVMLSAALLVFTGLGLAETLVGTVSDSMCGAKHAAASAAATACVQKCVAAGSSYVLVSKGKVYSLDAQGKFKDFAGQSVKVTGSVSGDSIKVQSVAPAGKATS